MFVPLLLCEADERPVLEGSELRRQLSVGKADKGPWLYRTTKVGSYASNKLGLHDMHGNVWQWTSSREGASPRVSRGSGWNSHGIHSQAALCNPITPSNRFNSLGLRLARVPSAPAGK